MKRCTKCGIEKPLDEFSRDRSRKDGRHPWCKPCGRSARNAWYGQNRETNLAYQAKWREKNKDRKAASNREWREANAEQKRENDQRWREANKPHLTAYFREHYQKMKMDPEYRTKRREANRRRRAIECNAYSGPVNFDAILLRDIGTCGICAKPILEDTIELDHILPLIAGGVHAPDNVQLAHRTCNRRKSAKIDFTLADAA